MKDKRISYASQVGLDNLVTLGANTHLLTFPPLQLETLEKKNMFLY